MAAGAKTSSSKILHNSFWFGLESLLETIVFLGTGIAVARYLGPEKLGYFSYINFFIVVMTRTSGEGLSTATRKYMSEFLGKNQPGTARAVYVLAHRYQLLGSLAISALGVAGVILFGDPHFRLMSIILMLSIVPGLMSSVPAQANQAFEDVAPNTRSAFGYIGVYATIIVLTVHFRWDLVGVASATLVGRTVEVFLRTVPLHRKLRKMPLDKLDGGIIKRIRRFCFQAVGMQLLLSLLSDRSEMVLLHHFAPIVQSAYYSLAVTYSVNLLMFARVLTYSTGVSIMVEASREEGRVHQLMSNSCRYLLLIIVPVGLGAAAIVRPAVGVAYDARYLAAVPAMLVTGLLMIPRVFQTTFDTLLKAADRQNRIIFWYCTIAVLNVGLDLFFIPRYGAVGAAWGNGLAQCIQCVAIWWEARRVYDFQFPVSSAFRILFASLPMAATAYMVSHTVHGLPGVLLAVLAAIPVFLLLLKLLRFLEPSDRQRLTPIGNRLPGPARRVWVATVEFLAAPAV